MATSYLSQLSLFTALFLAGLLLSYLSDKIKVPKVLLLLLLGFSISFFKLIPVESLLSSNSVAILSLFALIMIVFTSTSEFKIKEVQTLSPLVIKLAFIFLGLVLIFLTTFTHLIFSSSILDTKFLLLSAVFAGLMSGTSPDVELSALKGKKNKILDILKLESILNTPLTVIFPLIILDIYLGRLQAPTIFLVKFLQQIMTGAGSGLILGLISVQLIKRLSLEKISPLLIIALALGIFSIAENIGGNGVLAVTGFGIIFGRSTIKEKVELQKFGDLFTEFLEIIVFLFLGMFIIIPLTKDFLIKSILLFLIYLLIRYFSIILTFKGKALTQKEKIYMALSVPKGIASAVVVFILSTLQLPQLSTILSLTLAFILYSIILYSLVSWSTNFFLSSTLKEVKTKNLKKI